MTGEMVVCAFYRLAKIKGKYAKEHKDLIRSRAVITEDYRDQINSNTEDSGLMYVEDKEATKKYYEDSAIDYQRRKDAAELSNKAAHTLAKAVQGITTGAIETAKKEEKKPEVKKEEKKEPEAVVIPDGAPNSSWDRPQLMAWLVIQKDIPKFKLTLGKDRLLSEVVLPYLESLTSSDDKGNENTDSKTEE